MIPATRSQTAGWLAAVGGTALLVALVALPPFVGEGLRAALMQGFAAACHQMPERSVHLGGVPLAVCHRCLGIYAGVLLGALAFPLVPRGWMDEAVQGRRAGLLLVAAGLPTAVDWAVGVLGLGANTPVSRMATGALFGVVAGVLLARAVAQIGAAPQRAVREAGR